MTINKMAWVVSGVSFLAIAGGNFLGTTWLSARLPLPTIAQHDAVALPVGHGAAAPARAITDSSLHRFAALDETNAFWRCPADLRQQLPIPGRWEVKMQGCVVAYVTDAVQAQRLSQQLDRQLQDPQTNWLEVRPKLVGDRATIQQGQQVLLRLEPTIAAQLGTHPHRLITDWANNIRRVAGQSPLTFAQAQKQMYTVVETAHTSQGAASWYGPYFHGRMTANGEIYNQNDLTAAHRTLPLGTYVQVTNRQNGQSLVVRINDRGPYHDEDNRIIDLSYKAAQMLDGEHQGVMPIDLVVLQAGMKLPPAPQTIAWIGANRDSQDRRMIR